MSNNIYLNQIDPLLQNTMSRQYIQEPNFVTNPIQYTPKDYIGMLDDRLKNLTDTEKSMLMENDVFTTLNETFNALVQREIMNLIRGKLNSDGTVVDNINHQIEIINNVSNKVKNQERQNLSMMNDYITNYSNISFAEYQAMRAGTKPIETVSEAKPAEDDNKKKFFNR